MPVSLPKRINPALFYSLDGRMSTEAQATLTAAQSIVSSGRNIDDPELLARAVAVMVMYANSMRWPRPLVFPTLGMIAATFDRKICTGSLKRYLVGVGLRILYRQLERTALRDHGGQRAPGWNDYHLALWFMTGDEGELEELHLRATLPATDGPGHMIRSSAIWMVNSVRSQYPDFDLALKGLETRLNAPVATEDPTPAPWPGVPA